MCFLSNIILQTKIMKRSPDFLGIGAQRSGTSWIFACMYEHPEIFMPEKEINFFSRSRNWSKGFDWYENQFGECPADRLAGEYSTSYLSDPQTPERISNHYPDVKLIVSLRDPIDRAYSSYKYDIMNGNLNKSCSFEEAIQSNEKYIQWSLYATHLNRYLKYFDQSKLLILIYKNICEDPGAVMYRIFDFLGIETTYQPSMLNERINPGHQSKVPMFNQFINYVSDVLRSRSWTRYIWWVGKKIGLGSQLRELNKKTNQEFDPPTPETIQSLNKQFMPEIEQLENKFQLSLEFWKRNQIHTP